MLNQEPLTLGEMLDGNRQDPAKPHIHYYWDLVQHTDEWLQTRCGILTASEMKHVITPTLKVANNDKTRTHLYDLAAQRITNFVEPTFQSFDMQRGVFDEIEAAQLYNQNYGGLQSCGFITNNKWGFTLGYSPDGLVHDSGLIETKSRLAKYQIETIVSGEMPSGFAIQVQTALLVSERDWCDFNSYCGGMHMITMRVYPDETIQAAIVEASTAFHEKLDQVIEAYHAKLADPNARLIPTERKDPETMGLKSSDNMQ